jgi:Ca-activated chloride channel homolog
MNLHSAQMMLSLSFRKLRQQGTIPALMVSLALWSASAQTPAPGTPAAQSPAAVILHDPTKPEVQLPLDIDRDPILSIDPDMPPADVNASATNSNNPRQAQKGQNGMYVLHADVDEVVQSCTVIDEKGHSVLDLTQADFQVWEDGVPQTINAFQHQDEPVSLGILVDNSGSMRDKRAAVNTAAMDLLRASNRQDSAFVVNFSDHAYLDQGFTSDLVALDRGLAHFDSKGTTAMYDAVAASADELSKHAQQRKEALLIITDGADNASRLTLQQAIRRVQNLGGPVVYTIGLLYDADRDEARDARTALQTLSDETGGVAYFPASLADVNRIAAEVATDIRNQYSIAYHSTKPANLGGYRTVRIEARAPRRGKLTVRTRRGYYAKPNVPTETAKGAQPQR